MGLVAEARKWWPLSLRCSGPPLRAASDESRLDPFSAALRGCVPWRGKVKCSHGLNQCAELVTHRYGTDQIAEVSFAEVVKPLHTLQSRMSP